MKQIYKHRIIGSRSKHELDILVLTRSFNPCIVDLTVEIQGILSPSAKPNGTGLVPFHFHEMRYFLPKSFLPIHLLVYSSPQEILSCENSSFRNFIFKEFGIDEGIIKNDFNKEYQYDLWRLRSAFIELMIADDSVESMYLDMTYKSVKYFSKSYGLQIKYSNSHKSSKEKLIDIGNSIFCSADNEGLQHFDNLVI